VTDACRGIGLPGAEGGPDSTEAMLAELRARGAEFVRSGDLRRQDAGAAARSA
jgi:hypothetical protein